ncbi:hypothetical protein [uncultured Roseibium sp.]|uniref:hypothetical protein n=1 Tax=uncultured Roseibium sp. TaxID=1936171 RepID=UPI00321657DE
MSLFHALADWMNVPYLQFAYGGKSPDRNGLSNPTIALTAPIPAQTTSRCCFSIQNEREWVQFCEKVLGLADLAVIRGSTAIPTGWRIAKSSMP